MGTRQDVAAALGAVEGLTGHPYAPTQVATGDAWPEWVGTDPVVTVGCVSLGDDEWRIRVALPAGSPESTADAVTGWLGPTLEALATVGLPGRAETVAIIVADGTTVPALQFELSTFPEGE